MGRFVLILSTVNGVVELFVNSIASATIKRVLRQNPQLIYSGRFYRAKLIRALDQSPRENDIFI